MTFRAELEIVTVLTRIIKIDDPPSEIYTPGPLIASTRCGQNVRVNAVSNSLIWAVSNFRQLKCRLARTNRKKRSAEEEQKKTKALNVIVCTWCRISLYFFSSV